MRTIVANGRVAVARTLAETLLSSLPDRWRHTMGVAARAQELSVTVPAADRDVLVVSAWLHDIGYSPSVRQTGFHPLDGAEYLHRTGWPMRVAGLVAHHSGATFMAQAEGWDAQLRGYPDESGPVSDALTYADQTVGPTGQPLPIHARMAEMLERHGAGSVQSRVHHVRAPYLLAAAERVEHRLAHAPGLVEI
jgi:putative nucleotidyltransferase with HDIG domain